MELRSKSKCFSRELQEIREAVIDEFTQVFSVSWLFLLLQLTLLDEFHLQLVLVTHCSLRPLTGELVVDKQAGLIGYYTVLQVYGPVAATSKLLKAVPLIQSLSNVGKQDRIKSEESKQFSPADVRFFRQFIPFVDQT